MKKLILVATAVFLSMVFVFPNTYAKTYQTKSTPHSVGLIELYTSQGCSSCPPADEWLGELEKSGTTKQQAIPLALHVDYWDYIGWKDQFAQKYFTKRQYRSRQLGHSSSVYTPQIMINGRDVRRVGFAKSIDNLRTQPPPVDLTVMATEGQNNSLSVEINFNRIAANAKQSQVMVVLAESKLVGNIHSGENEGRTLSHNHVARIWKNVGQVDSKLNTQLTLKKEWNRQNLALVVIVETSEMLPQQVVYLAL